MDFGFRIVGKYPGILSNDSFRDSNGFHPKCIHSEGRIQDLWISLIHGIRDRSCLFNNFKDSWGFFPCLICQKIRENCWKILSGFLPNSCWDVGNNCRKDHPKFLKTDAGFLTLQFLTETDPIPQDRTSWQDPVPPHTRTNSTNNSFQSSTGSTRNISTRKMPILPLCAARNRPTAPANPHPTPSNQSAPPFNATPSSPFKLWRFSQLRINLRINLQLIWILLFNSIRSYC